jgi:hypothetical protein
MSNQNHGTANPGVQYSGTGVPVQQELPGQMVLLPAFSRLIKIEHKKHETIQECFEAFHAANPWVYEGLVKLARLMRSRGKMKWGVGALFEVLRWHYTLTVDLNEEWKLNNNYRSRYARLIMSQETDLAGFFDLRELQAK